MVHVKCFIQLLNNILVENDKLFLWKNKMWFPVGKVWIQGVVICINYMETCQETLTLTIDDGTGFVTVRSVLRKSNSKNSKVSSGDYVMVLGSVCISKVPIGDKLILFIDDALVEKLDDPNYESLWIYEVLQISC